MRLERLRGLLFVKFFLVSGCRSAFQPPPDDFEMWQKSKPVHMQLVIAALLECGYPWPSAKYFRTYEYWGSTAMASWISWVTRQTPSTVCVHAVLFNTLSIIRNSTDAKALGSFGVVCAR